MRISRVGLKTNLLKRTWHNNWLQCRHTFQKPSPNAYGVSDRRTFTDSLTRLTGDEQKAVKTTAFDLQLNPAHPGLQFRKLEKPRDPNFSSVRVNKDIRLIVHKTAESLLLCYVDHHDKAYQWAERRKLEVHPKTGAAQIVEIRETVREIVIPRYVEASPTVPAKRRLLSSRTDDELLAYGVPVEWLNDVRAADEDTLLTLADHLPAEAAEALLELATGGSPAEIRATLPRDPFAHPDAQRRFRTLNNVEELERALEYPWEKWTVFLHPAQREIVERDYSGPARVAGSAGTGKTVVALHRAVFLAPEHPDSRVLLTTFSDPLANALQTKLRRLIHNEPRLGERIDVWSFDAIARRIFKRHPGHPRIVSSDKMREIMKEASAKAGAHKFSLRFLLSEWNDVVDAWQLESWEAYRDVRRLGRKTRLPEQKRAALWSIFERARQMLAGGNVVTSHQIRLHADRLFGPKFRTSTATWKIGEGLSPCSMVRHRALPYARRRWTKRKRLRSGFLRSRRKAFWSGICFMWPALAPEIICS